MIRGWKDGSMIIKSSSCSSREFGNQYTCQMAHNFLFKIFLFYVYRALSGRIPACQKRALDATIDGWEPATCNSNLRGSEAQASESTGIHKHTPTVSDTPMHK